MAAAALSSFDEFRSTLKYCFFLFQRPFTEALEEATRSQWRKLQEGDVVVKEDGQNNPLVDLRLTPEFGQALVAALADASGSLPSLPMPRTPEQATFWQQRAAGTLFPQAFEELSESTSHLETIRQAMAWHATCLQPGATPLRVFILGASARYEYIAAGAGPGGGGGGVDGAAQELTERLAAVVATAAPGRQAEILLCGRDVPSELHGRTFKSAGGEMSTMHFVGYMHDLPPADLKGSLSIALHSGLGLDHPELATSWPPTLQLLRAAAPVFLAVTSFNSVEHQTAERTLRAAFLTQLMVDQSGINPAGSLRGKDELRPFEFDGAQGKRNYCVLHARVLPPQQQSAEGWDLFD